MTPPTHPALDQGQLDRVGTALRRPNVTDASRRARVVAHIDGRPVTAVLTYWPIPAAERVGLGSGRHTNRGLRARVQLPSGARLSVPSRDVDLLPSFVVDERAAWEMDLDAALTADEADREALE